MGIGERQTESTHTRRERVGGGTEGGFKQNSKGEMQERVTHIACTFQK